MVACTSIVSFVPLAVVLGAFAFTRLVIKAIKCK